MIGKLKYINPCGLNVLLHDMEWLVLVPFCDLEPSSVLMDLSLSFVMSVMVVVWLFCSFCDSAHVSGFTPSLPTDGGGSVDLLSDETILERLQ